jgi:hypothetical protein
MVFNSYTFIVFFLVICFYITRLFQKMTGVTSAHGGAPRLVYTPTCLSYRKAQKKIIASN